VLFILHRRLTLFFLVGHARIAILYTVSCPVGHARNTVSYCLEDRIQCSVSKKIVYCILSLDHARNAIQSTMAMGTNLRRVLVMLATSL
jgi:hypothetical protein